MMDYQSLLDYESKQPQFVQPKIFVLSKDFLRDFVDKCNTLTDIKLEEFVQVNYQWLFRILNDEQGECEKSYISWILNNPGFVVSLVNVFSNKKDITDAERMICNQLYYDYLTQTIKEPDSKIANLYSLLVQLANKSVITVLFGEHIPDPYATMIAAAAYASDIPETNIRRVNWIIVQAGPDIMTPSVIKGLYEVVFKHMGELFKYTMLDVYNETMAADPDDLIQVDSNINMALLSELNDMPMASICEVLRRYAHEYASRSRKTYTPYRFSIRSIDPSYARILTAVQYIDAERFSDPNLLLP